MDISVEQFVALLANSGLISRGDLQAVLDEIPASERPKDAEQFARVLIDQKKLTDWQARQIFSGKAGSLVMGNYVIVDQLGQGGMGLVLKARHVRMKRVVAIKVLSPHFVRNEQSLKRFHREVEAAARLEHPNIVTAYDADEVQGTHFLVMQYVDGTDLSAFVKKNGPLSAELAANCILQAARGLEYAHKRGVIHRDIKPANLLIDQEGVVRVLDMGLARFDDADKARPTEGGLTSTNAIMGTVDYMSPEQAMDSKHADARSDIYSLGCTLFYLVAGRVPYSFDTVMKRLIAHRESPIPELSARWNQENRPGDSLQSFSGPDVLISTLNSIFRRMVAKKPVDRPQSMTEVISELERCLTGTLPSSGSSTITFVPSARAINAEDSTRLNATIISTVSDSSPSVRVADDITLAAPGGEETVAGSPSTTDATRLFRDAKVERIDQPNAPDELPTENVPLKRKASGANLAWPKVVLPIVVVLLMVVLMLIKRWPRDGSVVTEQSVGGSTLSIDFVEERRVAEQILKLNKGSIYLSDGTTEWELTSPLPDGPFHVHDVGLVEADISDEDLALLAGCRGLVRLDLRLNPKVTAAGLEKIGPQLNLDTLLLDDTACGLDSLNFLADYPRLITFSISGDCPEGLFRTLPSCPELTTLSTPYRSGCIGDEGIQAIAKHCPKLRELVISDDRDYSLAPFSQLRSLQQLHCYGVQLDEVSIAVLADLPDFRSLGIELPNSECMSQLGGLGTKIRKLSLRNQQGIGPESLTNASDWQHIADLTELEELKIMELILVDADLLKTVSGLPGLRAFHVYGDLSPEDHSKLRRYTADDIAAFRQSRPDVELHIDGKEFPAAP